MQHGFSVGGGVEREDHAVAQCAVAGAAEAADAVELAVVDWELVADPQPGDAILIRSLDPRWHIGVVCEDGWMLHSREGAGVAKERYNSFPWKARIEGFYRWKQISSPL